MDRLPTPSSPLSTGPDRSFEHVDWCVEKARLMLGCYRRGEANDPAVYANTVAALLANYPPEVVEEVTNPLRGMPVQTDFMPTPRELKIACEREANRQQNIKNMGRFQRRAIDYRKPAVPPANHEELIKKHGRFLGAFELPGDKWNKWGDGAVRDHPYGRRKSASEVRGND